MNVFREVRRLTKNCTLKFWKDRVTRDEENDRIFGRIVVVAWLLMRQRVRPNLARPFLAKHKVTQLRPPLS